MSFRPHLSLLPLLLLSLNTIQAQEQSLDTLQPIQGDAVRGKVASIDAAGKVTVAIGDESVTRDLASLRTIDLAVWVGPPVSSQGFVLLRSGLRIPATVRETAGRSLTVDSPLTDGRTKLALSHVRAIRFARLASENDGGFAKYVLAPKAEKDLIYFKTATKIVQRSVRVVGFVDGSLQYEARGDIRSRKLSDLYGIVMAKASGFAPDPLPRTRVVLGMQGGTSVTGKLLKLGGEFGELQLAEKVKLKVHRSRIRRITVQSHRLVYLAELTPSIVRQTTAFRQKKPWLKNRSPLGDGIQLGGKNPRTTNNGLVLRPKTSLTYDIDSKFDFFIATIGIDSRSTGPAHAIFRVRDGEKVLFESKPITRQSEPLSIKIAVDKVDRLTIEADFGKNFDFGDHCVFAEARVIKQGP